MLTFERENNKRPGLSTSFRCSSRLVPSSGLLICDVLIAGQQLNFYGLNHWFEKNK
jgi:hypothetical protein